MLAYTIVLFPAAVNGDIILHAFHIIYFSKIDLEQLSFGFCFYKNVIIILFGYCSCVFSIL